MRMMTLHSILLFGCLGCATSHPAPSTERPNGVETVAKTDAREELFAATRAEDEAVKALDTAIKARERPDVIEPLTQQYRQCIEKTDALVNKVFTPEVIERTPWTNLLADPQKDYWQHVAFQSWQITDGVLDCVGPALDAKQTAIMSIGDLEQWRDFVLDVEFTLVAGESAFHFRLGPFVNTSTLSLKVACDGEGHSDADTSFRLGASNQMTVTLLGSSWRVDFADPAHASHDEPEVPWVIRRKGAVAVSVPPGSAIRITRMRIKVLR
jgi:hypothetical protein